jgi:acetyltransferase-like isoleucine patch superfamily enzyme
MVHSSSLIYPGVQLTADAAVDPYVIVGLPAKNQAAGSIQTVIGARAVLRSHTVIYAGNRIGDDFQTGHGVLVREENRIGNNVSVGSHSIVEHHVEIGNGVRIHSNAFVPEYSVLESECWIGPCVVLTNARYPRSAGVKEALRGPIIRHRAKIGAGAVILPGVIIGEDALVGAGAVIVRDVAAGAVVAGNPARYLRAISEISHYQTKAGE